MSQSITTPPSRFNNRPPRINIQNIPNINSSAMGSMPPTGQPPLTAHTAHTLGPGSVAGQPYWPAYSNPFAAGNFMARGFDELVDFTKSGMSFGEKFTYGLYSKFSKWSRKWFTHMFLFIVICLYTAGGAFLFMAIEGRQSHQDKASAVTKSLELANATRIAHVEQMKFFNAIRQLVEDHEQFKYSNKEFDAHLTNSLRTHQAAVESLFVVNKTTEEVEIVKDPWTFWNTMFYCGTIYTTIVRNEINTASERYLQRLSDHINPLAISLLDSTNEIRRLKRSHVLDLPFRK